MTGDGDALARAVLAAALQRGTLIATAESCTGGMISAAITDIAGSSAVFDRGFVTYSNAAKRRMLGVRALTLRRYGAVSPEVAAEMATGALARSDAGIAVAVTGIAGPGGSGAKPEGRVCFGLALRPSVGTPDCITETVEFGAIGRGAVRAATVHHGLSLLVTALTR